ncbi:MAG: protein DA1 [Armatimonadetes bacterium]|nr:protein DA1 [Armatimonadota bacterium]
MSFLLLWFVFATTVPVAAQEGWSDDDSGGYTDAQSMLTQAAHIFATRFNMRVYPLPTLKVVSREELRAVASRISRGTAGGNLAGLYRTEYRGRTKTLSEIYVVTGLPESTTMAVVAHELAHAWQADNRRGGTSTELHEGFAEWAAYKVMESLGETGEVQRMLRRTDLYGRGLRRMLAIERSYGTQAVIRYARNARG